MSEHIGGLAFPVSTEYGPKIDSDSGMSLRDYFAAKAPINVSDAMVFIGLDVGSVGVLGENRRAEVFVALAKLRGQYADAMLAERAK